MPTVLVVDDDAQICRLMSEILGGEGFRVVAAEGGHAARRAFGPDLGLVLVDMRLPDVDGMALLREFKATRPGIPMVIMTGYGTPEVEAHATSMGADAFLRKPFTLDRLVNVARRLTSAPAA